MMIDSLKKYARKVQTVGIKEATRVASTRIISTYYRSYWRRKALKQQAHHTWPAIAKKYALPDDALHFFKRQLPAFEQLAKHFDVFFKSYEPETVLTLAQRYKHEVRIFNSAWVVRTPEIWHTDICLREANGAADALFEKTFYQDIVIDTGKDTFIKDIKVPWELSRFYHGPLLVYATRISDDESYAVAAIDQIIEWIEANPYLYGVNWVCPMEVGLRAINWIWTLAGTTAYHNLDPQKLSVILSCLYDHLVYLEHHWELYDGRTSNHYLSNIVGYLALVWFFSGAQGMDRKTAWAVKELEREMEKQVLPDGTDYEGSTAYHGLVTELMYHGALMAGEQGITLSAPFNEKRAAMLTFIAQTTTAGSQILIGDNDAGRVLITGLPNDLYAQCARQGVYTWREFGLSIIRTQDVHVSLRHHVYRSRQPSGHFHSDAASITLSYQGIPLIIDPGTYVYTPSIYWRNYMRSMQVHNTFFEQGIEPIPVTDNLFYLNVPETQLDGGHSQDKNSFTMFTRHHLFGTRAAREIMYDHSTNTILVNDSVVSPDSKTLRWHWMLHPSIKAELADGGVTLYYQQKQVAHVASADFLFELKPGFCALSYRQLSVTQTIHAQLHNNTKICASWCIRL